MIIWNLFYYPSMLTIGKISTAHVYLLIMVRYYLLIFYCNFVSGLAELKKA